MGIRRGELTLLGLLVLVLSIAGCSQEIPEYSYPCGPAMYEGRDYHRVFLVWTPNASHIIFGNIRTISVVDAAGTRLRRLVDVDLGHGIRYGTHADVSPNGTQVVYATCEYSSERDVRYEPDPERAKYHYEIAVINLDGTGQQRITENIYLDHYPVWSPDGSRIAFIARLPSDDYTNEDGARLYTMAADGSDMRNVVPRLRTLTMLELHNSKDDETVLKLRGVAFAPPVWSPDGEHLAFLVKEGDRWTFGKIPYTVRIDGSGLTRIAENALSIPAWSPDGQRIALAMYVDDDVGLFTLAADGSDPKLLTTITDRSWIHTVLWSPDGAHILHTCDVGVCVVNRDGVRVGEMPLSLINDWDGRHIAAWSPDGSRIAVYAALDDIFSDTYTNNGIVLYTMAMDGTNVQVLVRDSDLAGQ